MENGFCAACPQNIKVKVKEEKVSQKAKTFNMGHQLITSDTVSEV